jgi:hypothetical protein
MYNNGDRLRNIRTGDTVERVLCGMLPMQLKVSQVTKHRIICGTLEFSRANGAELDEDLGWTGGESGSYIRPRVDSTA